MIWLNLVLSALIGSVALWSMQAYPRLRERVIVLLAASCIVVLLWHEHWTPCLVHQLQEVFPTSPAPLVIDSDQTPTLSANRIREIERSTQIQLKGDGFRESQWQDVSARNVQWEKPLNRPALQLQFNPSVSLGREFDLAIQRDIGTASSVASWRAQLLAENGVLLAEEKSQTATLKLRWLAPVAERMVLQLKVFDEHDVLIDAGPVPLEVRALYPLQVWMRLDAPSFDALSLQKLLRQSQAVIDVQTRLGQNILHIETPVVDVTRSDLMIVDAAFLEQQNGAALQKILGQVAEGKNLLVLGANANQANFWRQRFELPLQATNFSKDAEVTIDIAPLGNLSLSPNTLAVVANDGKGVSTWKAYPQSKNSAPWLWQRPWLKGQIAWIAVSDWHRHAITSPKALTAWWQRVIDQVQQTNAQQITWSILGEMPVAHERQIVCLQGVNSGELVTVPNVEAIPLRSYGEVVDQMCAAWRPAQAGWQTMNLMSPELKEPIEHALYVYPGDAWPSWQRHLKASANQAFAQRLPGPATMLPPVLLLWPLYLLIALLLLCLWRRDTQRG